MKIETRESQVVYAERPFTEKQIELESFVKLAEERAENASKYWYACSVLI